MRDEWQSVTSLPPLETGEVQIWRVDLSQAAADPNIYMANLSPDEAERAGRFRALQVRQQFVVARACLRGLLANLMDLRPPEVPITLTAYGKPELSPDSGQTVSFNVAHSRETVLIALCRDGRVGVDLEYLDRETDVLEIARNSFTTDEFHQIEQAAAPADRQRAFFRCWTRKEAVLKADGRGLSIPLSSVEVPVIHRANSAPVCITASGPAAEDATWFVTDLPMGDAIAGAFATGKSGLTPRTLAFPPELLR